MNALLRGLVPASVKNAVHRWRDPLYGVSSGYEASTPEAAERLKDAWQDAGIPARQRRVVDAELARSRAGDPPAVYAVLAEAVRATGREQGSVLEIGAASGYYSEALPLVLGHPLDYTGVDYSRPLIDMARRLYPQARFEVADATALPFGDASFDVAVSGCVLLHVPDYKKAIRETVRVSREWAIFHRTPVKDGETQWFEKQAYGVRCMEIRFGEDELRREFAAAGLTVVQEWTLGTDEAGDTKTYLCRRA